MLCLILYSAIVTPQSKPTRVLVIDDDPMSRDLLSVLLQAEGYEVECAESGEYAIAHILHSATAHCLVLADAQMPGLTGAGLAGELRRVCPAETLLLAMSGSRPPEQAIANFDGFLLKPFTMEQIAAALQAHKSSSAAPKAAARRERWTVVRGPAGRTPSNARLISISASSAPQTASSRRARGQPQQLSSAQAAPGRLPGDQPVLNEDTYQQLAASMPAAQLLQMYAMCLNDVRTRITTMRRLVAAHDGPAFVREAHSIKGGCGMLGAVELYRIAAEMESVGLEAATVEGVQAVNSLDELTYACDRLERILGSRV
ncbi:MAG TPA: response regulator [Acidobacteriaceae bacterium]|jgi:CheY-like chemotaxis protein/HPt (histidine-containing phosphotransfer) domain-containing protein|nr:response regulator [Acidobacteriaceae bacterium]